MIVNILKQWGIFFRLALAAVLVMLAYCSLTPAFLTAAAFKVASDLATKTT